MEENLLPENLIIAEVSFEQAVENFKKFLARNNLSTDILWIFVEDTYSRNNEFHETNFWLKLPIPEDNEKAAKAYYTIGQQKEFGVCISAFALCENKICCSLIIPKDEEDSGYLLMSPKYLKFTFLKDLPVANLVRSNFRWSLFSLLPFKYKKGCFLDYLQSKRHLADGN